jgi:putative FmdB family regulatory protein
MPTYDYVCENGHRFELFQSMKDAALDRCTQCDAPARRVIGPGAGFIFKGGGFYSTDYRSKEYKEKAKSESGGGSASDTSGGGKSSGAGTPAGGKSGDAAKPAGSGTGAAPGGSSGDATKGGSSGGGSSKGGSSGGKPPRDGE